MLSSRTDEIIRRQAEYGISTLPEGREPSVFVEGKGLIPCRFVVPQEYELLCREAL
jgi:hypothetical protein